jgi:hypothetical protein
VDGVSSNDLMGIRTFPSGYAVMVVVKCAGCSARE